MPPKKRRAKAGDHEQSRSNSSAEENHREVFHKSQHRKQHRSQEDDENVQSSEHQHKEKGSHDTSPDISMNSDSICAGQKPKNQNDLKNEIGFELKYDSTKSSPLPRRPGFGNLGKRIKLIANCYPIKVPSGNVYHYDVDVCDIDKSFSEENRSDEDPNQTADEVTGQNRSNKKYRCLKTKEKRRVVQAMLERDAIFNRRYAAYDGEKNLYTRKPLRAVFPYTFTTNENDEIKGRVTIKPVKKKDMTSCAINLDSIHAFYDKITNEAPLEAVAALETILRHGACLRLTPIGRSFFSAPGPGSLNPLGGGLEVWFGYHQGVILNQWNVSVNLNISATTFLPGGPLVNYIAGLLETTKESLQRRPILTNRDISKINHKLRGKRVKATHTHQGRKYTVLALLRKNASELQLTNEDEKTVAQYFMERYGLKLKYPNLPCFQAQPKERGVYLPVEVCELIPGQHYNKELSTAQKTEMIKFTSPAPRERFQKIKNKVNFKNDKLVQAFDIEVSEDPMRLEGRVLDPPSLIYRDDQKVRPRDGSWNMRDTKFFQAAEIKAWVVLSFVRNLKDSLNEFCECFGVVGRKLGIDIKHPTCKRFIDAGCEIKELLSCMKTEFKANLVLIIVPDENESIYRNVKKSAETLIGLVTQVITEKTFNKIMDPRNRSYEQLIANIFLKINSKMGGVNYSLMLSEIPPILWKPVIVIGADVNHPGSFRGFKSSLAACAGSLDARCSLYAVRTRPQKNEDENKKSLEIIVDLESMVMDLLRAFYRHTRQKPEKIIFYRDGVSEGEFQKVRNSEVVSVRKACRNINADYQPAITFIVVQKRHHMRFMLQDPRDGRNLNLPASTVIDTDVTHPENFDFYLNSQNCPKGTARPAHYTVIEDDNKFTANDLQKFTNQLCYTFVRCTKSISIPAPVAYADLAAYRARQYLDLGNDGSTASSVSSTNLLTSIEDANECIKVVKELKNRMYFV